MGFALGVASKVKRLFFSPPIKEKKDPVERNILYPGHGSGGTDFGSKDETFFDTRLWLDSDCEDDYYSVNGDFTPSRGSTPNRLFGATGTPQRNGKAFNVGMHPDSRSESPTEKKKLAELLQVSLSEQEGNEPNNIIDKGDGTVKPDDGAIGKTDAEDVEISQPRSSSEGTPKLKKVKSSLTASCCMPGLIPGISSRKQKTIPSC
ncbi:hypothetical protein KSP40_PGU004142 [Platanthera guangdongensis]|uniref:Uncharacterized protein n=1 Tax=Platanthera guangdongensis TaxID=2320717 RepID=A0ABR2M3Y5_9ASPA